MSQRKDAPLSEEAKAFADKLFPCTKPCDSYGVCEGCTERIIFQAGYNMGYRAAPKVDLVAIHDELFENRHISPEDQEFMRKANRGELRFCDQCDGPDLDGGHLPGCDPKKRS